MKKIKIVFHVLPFMFGGPERFLLNLLKHIDRDRFEPIVVSFAKSPLFPFLKPLNIRTKVIPSAGRHGHKLLADFLKRERIELVQTSHYYPKTALAASLAGIPHIWRAGSSIHEVCSGIPRVKRVDFLSVMACLSAKIICVSKFVADSFLEVARGKIITIYPGIDLKEIRKIQENIRPAGFQNRPWRVGMVAHISPQKRHLDFIKAAKKILAKIPHTQFFIFGRAYPNQESRAYRQFLVQKINELGLKKYFTFKEANNALEEIQLLDILALPSVGEGLSNGLLEGTGSGKPVVACNSGGPREVVLDGLTGFLIPPYTPDKLAERIIQILRNPDKAKQMGLNGKKRAEKSFNILESAKKFEIIYLDIINKFIPDSTPVFRSKVENGGMTK